MADIPTGPDETITYIYNPSKDDFTQNWDGKPYTMPSRKISSFPKWLADHMSKNLARKLAVDEGGGSHFEDRYKKWMEIITTTI